MNDKRDGNISPKLCQLMLNKHGEWHCTACLQTGNDIHTGVFLPYLRVVHQATIFVGERSKGVEQQYEPFEET